MWMEVGWGWNWRWDGDVPKLSGMKELYGWRWYKPVLGALKPLRTAPGTPWQPEGAGMGLAPQRPPDTPITAPGTGRGRERPGGVVVTF